MKKTKKTYAILHLAEKHTIFHLGKTKVHVSFTGGQVTKTGVTPATFTTDDPIVQLAIENSPDYNRGAVRLLSEYPAEGDVMIGMNPAEPPCPMKEEQPPGDKPADAEADGPLAKARGLDKKTEAEGSAEKPAEAEGSAEKPAEAEGSAEKPAEAEGSADGPLAEARGSDKKTEAEGSAEKPADEEKDAETEAGAPTDGADESAPGNLEVIEVSCKDVAKQYLQEHYGEKPAPLRKVADIQECAAKYGITFSFV